MEKLMINQVSKVYGEKESSVKALDSVSLNVKEGEFIAVVGPSGSGKTSLLAIVGALLKPTQGSIKLNGIEMKGLTSSQLTKIRMNQIGFILQSSNLIPYLTAKDQLLLLSHMAGNNGREYRNRAEELLSNLGLAHRMNHYPEALSGGEKQRVAIARALMNNPDIILADEPTASLDTQRGREVVQMLVKEVKTRKKAAIMVTHDERMLDLCDRIMRMTDGKLTELRA
ncbi:ABC transporter ATP-binding protein [Cohnella sp. WQ 127256]|uniref:ABC transporter ATP-binding protein n=1 Tax=Cohnella sp. WQ 127256 TaxID=2938790 RepID=UPI002118674B|nr:ABC transporter ATP-binding protein [Cohnella sp. WQ 127256]